jgi:membrane AbrB-like protein
MPLPSRQILLHFGETLLTGIIGGAVFSFLGVPVGWLSGAMVFVAGSALAGRPVHVPPPFARVVFVLIGISLGGAVTPETLRGVATWPLSVILLCLGMTAATFASAFYLKTVHGWDMLSALFGAAPGALSQVIAYATQYHSDLRGIAIVQSVRAAILIAFVPGGLALAGMMPSVSPARDFAIADSIPEIAILIVASSVTAVLAHAVRFPGGYIFGAMLASALLHGSGLIHAVMPWWAVSAAMVGLGSLIGSRFANTGLRLLSRYVLAALGSFSAAVLTVAVFAAAATRLLGLQLPDVVVSYAPGGLDAMMILALALHLDPIFVGAHHVARFILVSLSLPVYVRLYGQTPPPPPAKLPEKRPVQED